MSAQPVNVLAVMQEFAIANGSLEMGAARQAVAEQQRILRQLATWNRNPNGDGDELSALCAAAEILHPCPHSPAPFRFASARRISRATNHRCRRRSCSLIGALSSGGEAPAPET